MKRIILSFKIVFLCFLFIIILIFISYYTHPNYINLKLKFYFKEFRIEGRFFKSRKRCFNEINYPLKLNNRYFDYINHSFNNKFGKELKNSNEIKAHYFSNKLKYIESNERYIIDTLYYSYSFLVPKAKILLDDISKKFQYLIQNTSLKNKKIHISSLLRTIQSVKRLKRRNTNSIKTSSHLHGTSFDIDYLRYSYNINLSKYEIYYLKNILARVLYEFKKSKKCYVTYETKQSCFHVVLRNMN